MIIVFFISSSNIKICKTEFIKAKCARMNINKKEYVMELPNIVENNL